MSIRIGVDIGGAFTDLVGFDEETGDLFWVKVETTPKDPSKGVLESVKKSRLPLPKTYAFIHGQTLVINTILTRTGAKVGLLTTKGYRDVLEIQRSNRRDMYNFKYKKPEPLVPRYLRREVNERIMADGTVLKPLDENSLKEAVERLVREKVESIAVTFINSYANEIHEKKAKEFIKEKYPNIPVSVSHEITREWREYERTSTTVLNAYVKPRMESYLGILEKGLRDMGFKGTAYAMLSNGGMASFSFVAEYPITSIESGPVAGVIGALQIGNIIGEKNIIALDGGSTTTKASLVENLTPKVTTEYHVERDRWRAGYPVRVPVVETVEVGNGGTSIAWIDEVGNLRVGPKAAGAEPGPACYAKGGTEPTVTDAYVVTGLLNPEYLLGGELKIKKELAEKAIKEKIADYYNVSVEEAAEGIVKIANENAANVIRIISVQRGYDPRDFALVAYGGSGPIFAPFIAQELEISKIAIPAIHPGVFSAWGLLATDIRHDLVHTDITLLSKENLEKINASYEKLEKEITEIFKQEGITPEKIVYHRFADMRYFGQEHTVKVPIMGNTIKEEDLPTIAERFHQIHKREYEFRLDGNPVEIVNYHLTAYAIVKKVELKPITNEGRSLEKALLTEREVYLNGRFQTMPIYNRDMLPIDSKIEGPAILEDPTSTVIILPNQRGVVDKYGNIIVTWR